MGASTPLCQPALAAHSLTATTAGQRAMVSRHAWIETLLPLCPRPAPRDPLARVRSPLAQLGADRLTVRRSSYAYAAQRATSGSNSNPKTTSPSSYKRFASSLSLTRFLRLASSSDSSRVQPETAPCELGRAVGKADAQCCCSQILETSDKIDPDTLALSNQPRGGENLVTGITGDLKTLGIRSVAHLLRVLSAGEMSRSFCPSVNAQPRRPLVRVVQATPGSFRSLVPSRIRYCHSLLGTHRPRCDSLRQGHPHHRRDCPADRFHLKFGRRSTLLLLDFARQWLQRQEIGGQQTLGRSARRPGRFVLGSQGRQDSETKGAARVPLRTQEHVRLLHASRGEPLDKPFLLLPRSRR
jgi:hypothetical protein